MDIWLRHTTQLPHHNLFPVPEVTSRRYLTPTPADRQDEGCRHPRPAGVRRGHC